jgi:hypothetical protein
MMRGDELGKEKVYTYLTKIGDPLEKLNRFERIKQKLGAKRPMTDAEARAKMDEYIQD